MKRLDAESQCEGELLSQRRCHTSGVDELRILSVELVVGVEQEQVGGVELERGRAQSPILLRNDFGTS